MVHDEADLLKKLNSLRLDDEAGMRQVMDACTRDKGPDHCLTVTATSYLAASLMDLDKFAEAMPLAQRVLTWHERMGDEDRTDLVQSKVHLGQCLKGLKRYDEAERQLTGALNMAQRELGHESETTIKCCNNLAIMWGTMGKLTEAEGMLRRALDFNMRLLRPEHWQTISCLQSLGQCLSTMGKVEEALLVLREALRLNRRVHGFRHELTVRSMQALGEALVMSAAAQGDYEHADIKEAEGLFGLVMEMSFRLMGRDHPFTLTAVGRLSGLLCLLPGRSLEALPLCCLELMMQQRAYGGEHSAAFEAMVSLANVLQSLGQRTEAEVWARKAMEGFTRVLGPEDPATKQAASMVRSLAPAVPHPSKASKGKGSGKARR